MNPEHNLYDLIYSAAMSMTPQPLVIWGTPQEFNMGADDMDKYETALFILPSSTDGRPSGHNKLVEFETCKTIILKRSDVAADMDTDRRWNIEECEAFGRELYGRVKALSQEAVFKGQLKVESYTFAPALDDREIDGYFNIFDVQGDAVGMFFNVEKTIILGFCFDGGNRVKIDLIER